MKEFSKTEQFIAACRSTSKSKGWRWSKGMRILEGWGFGETGRDKIDCSGALVDDVIIGRPFSDKYMQSVKSPVPDFSDERTIELAVEILREHWVYPDLKLIESGDGWALIVRGGQHWAPTTSEVILTGFELINWNDKDGGRWKTK